MVSRDLREVNSWRTVLESLVIGPPAVYNFPAITHGTENLMSQEFLHRTVDSLQKKKGNGCQVNGPKVAKFLDR